MKKMIMKQYSLNWYSFFRFIYVLLIFQSPINSQSEQLESNTQMDDEDWPEGDDINVTLAMNEACTHLITEMINKIERALQENHEKQVDSSV